MICIICKKEITRGKGRAIAWEHTSDIGPRMLYAHHGCTERLPKTFHGNDDSDKTTTVHKRIADIVNRSDGDDA